MKNLKLLDGVIGRVMSDSAETFYDFPPFRVDARRHMMLREGAPVHLQHKTYQILLALVQNRGRLMTKKELMERVWPERFVEERNLAQHIFYLRKILGEGRDDHRYIITVPGEGYSFVAPVEEPCDEAAPARGGQPSAADESRRPETSLAVLPFKTVAEGEEAKYLKVGLADALIMRLASLKGITVRPTASVFRYADSDEDPLKAGRELGVALLLDGLFQHLGDSIRVSAQLVRVEDGTTLWAKKFDEKYTDIFSIQDSISEQAAQALSIRLTQDERELLARRHTQSPEAHRLYLLGLHFNNKGYVDDVRKAIEYLNRSIEADQTYALPHAALADSYFRLADREHDPVKLKEGYEKMRAAASAALALDEKNASAHAALAVVEIKQERNAAEAERLFERSLTLDPGAPVAHLWYGSFLVSMGRLADGLRLTARARELDPLSPRVNGVLGLLHYLARQYDESLKHSATALSLDPHYAHAVMQRALVHCAKGDVTAAASELQKIGEAQGDSVLYLEVLGYVRAVSGRGDVTEVLRELEARAANENVASYNVAAIYAALGRHDRALEWLERQCANWTERLRRLRFDPRLDPLRAAPRFDALLKRDACEAAESAPPTLKHNP